MSKTEDTGKRDDGPKLDKFLCFAVYSAGHAFNRMYKPLLREIGLTYPQYLAMVLLWERDGRTVGDLGENLFLETNTVTPLLKRLETLGYVVRTRDPADERQVRVHLTDPGRGLRDRARDIPSCVLEASGLRAGEADRLLTEISALRDALAANDRD